MHPEKKGRGRPAKQPKVPPPLPTPPTQSSPGPSEWTSSKVFSSGWSHPKAAAMQQIVKPSSAAMLHPMQPAAGTSTTTTSNQQQAQQQQHGGFGDPPGVLTQSSKSQQLQQQHGGSADPPGCSTQSSGGFKSLKRKWIQDHSQEQMDRERRIKEEEVARLACEQAVQEAKLREEQRLAQERADREAQERLAQEARLKAAAEQAAAAKLAAEAEAAAVAAAAAQAQAEAEVAKAVAAKAEAAKVEAAKVEAAKAEAVKAEAAKVEAARVEAAKVEAAKAEAVKAEVARVEAAKAEATKAEAAKAELAVAALAAAAAAVVAARLKAESEPLCPAPVKRTVSAAVSSAMAAEAAAILKASRAQVLDDFEDSLFTPLLSTAPCVTATTAAAAAAAAGTSSGTPWTSLAGTTAGGADEAVPRAGSGVKAADWKASKDACLPGKERGGGKRTRRASDALRQASKLPKAAEPLLQAHSSLTGSSDGKQGCDAGADRAASTGTRKREGQAGNMDLHAVAKTDAVMAAAAVGGIPPGRPSPSQALGVTREGPSAKKPRMGQTLLPVDAGKAGPSGSNSVADKVGDATQRKQKQPTSPVKAAAQQQQLEPSSSKQGAGEGDGGRASSPDEPGPCPAGPSAVPLKGKHRQLQTGKVSASRQAANTAAAAAAAAAAAVAATGVSKGRAAPDGDRPGSSTPAVVQRLQKGQRHLGGLGAVSSSSLGLSDSGGGVGGSGEAQPSRSGLSVDAGCPVGSSGWGDDDKGPVQGEDCGGRQAHPGGHSRARKEQQQGVLPLPSGGGGGGGGGPQRTEAKRQSRLKRQVLTKDLEPAASGQCAEVAESSGGQAAGGGPPPAVPAAAAASAVTIGHTATGGEMRCTDSEAGAPLGGRGGLHYAVECAVEGPTGQRITLEVDIGKLHSFKELWSHLSAALPSGSMPDRLDGRIVYMDVDGDWMLAMPDEHWASFIHNAIKVLVCSNC